MDNQESGVAGAVVGGRKGRVSHLLSDEGPISRFDRWVEFFSAILLALTTIATAWCGYQSTLWGGEEMRYRAEANAANVRAAQAANQASQKSAIHVNLFVAWAAAYSEDNMRLADFLYERFPPPLNDATDAWLAAEPQQNPDAPASPFAMPEYVLEEQAQMAEWEEQSAANVQAADKADEISDRYVMLTVIFASALFFGGISGKFQSQLIDMAMFVMGAVVFLAGLGILVTFPVQ